MLKLKRCAAAVALILALLSGTARPLSLENVSLVGTLLHWSKYRTKEEAAATRASFNRDKRFIKEDDKNIKIAFNSGVNRVGVVGFDIRPMQANQALFFSILSSGCTTLMKIRLWEEDGDFWETKSFSLDFFGWKDFLLEGSALKFYPGPNGKRAWPEIRHVQIVLEGNSCTVYADALKFVPNSDTSLDGQR